MTQLPNLDPKTTAEKLARGEITLVDIREPDEHARENISGAVSLPLSRLQEAHLHVEGDKQVVFHCKSGMRTSSNCSALTEHVSGAAYLLEGGLDGWKKAGLPVQTDTKAPLPINRQVQITAGGLALAGAVLAQTVDPNFIWLSGFIGAGLMFAGISGWCGMANALAIMPWNRRAA
ncbi:MAG: rhodanese family protein [Henriciella sp.]|nr:rhodanese family protein [Hyphomonadaceae bacterium]